MDYPKLYSELPKDPIKWTVTDIQIWLQFIGLSSLYDKFSTFVFIKNNFPLMEVAWTL